MNRSLSPLINENESMSTSTYPNNAIICEPIGRCLAKCMSGERCSRKNRGDANFCGTHIKNTPYGLADKADNDSPPPTHKNVDIWPQEIYGIPYYIDKCGNVYDHIYVLQKKPDPPIIAKWTKNSEDNIDIVFVHEQNNK